MHFGTQTYNQLLFSVFLCFTLISFAFADTEKSLIDDIKPGSCGVCHVQQYTQWNDSYHAEATSPGLLGQLPLLDEEEVRDCFSCHLPDTKQQNNYLENNSNAIHGVDCSYCHIRNEQRYGPREKQLTPHGEVKFDPLFKKSEFCKDCHQFGNEGILVNGKPLENTYVEWQSSRYPAEGKSCQSCHMPSADHDFKGIHNLNMVRSGLSLQAKFNDTELIITLTNKGAGHALPTYITPRIRVLWKGDNGIEKPIATIQRKMNWQAESGWTEVFDTRLMPDEKRKIVFNTESDNAGYIEVWVDPDADYSDRVYPAIIEALVESNGPDSPVNQINQAQEIASTSNYLLYKLRCNAGKQGECY
ncbi:MAG: hypothetical protein GWO88_00660 [Planctomycetia bacterium]|nr:hypothetical protein [Planctomycetia bacterium]